MLEPMDLNNLMVYSLAKEAQIPSIPGGSWKPHREALTLVNANGGWQGMFTRMGFDPVEKDGESYLQGIDGWAWTCVMRFQTAFSEYEKQLAKEFTHSLLSHEGLLAFAWCRLRHDESLLLKAEALALDALYGKPPPPVQQTLAGLREIGLLPVTLVEVVRGFLDYIPPQPAPTPALEPDDVDFEEAAPVVHADGHPF